MNRAEILDTAKQIVTQDRNVQHGEPEDSFSRIAGHWGLVAARQAPARCHAHGIRRGADDGGVQTSPSVPQPIACRLPR